MKRSDISTLIVLESARLAHTERDKMTWEYIQEKIIAPEKIIYAAMERELKKGFLEYGVSLRTGWLTAKGEDKLKELQD